MMTTGRTGGNGAGGYVVGVSSVNGRRLEIEEHSKWLGQRGLSEGTQGSYGRTLRQLERWLNLLGSDLVNTTPQQLRDWRESLKVAPNSVINYVTGIRSFYRWAQITGLIPINPSVDIPIPSRRKGRPRPISDDLLRQAILNAPRRIRPWLFLAALAGLRCAEIAGLRREDILDSADDPVIIVMGKGGKERIIPLSPQLWHELLEYGLPKSGIIFPRYDGAKGANKPKMLSRITNDYLRSVEITETLHQLRHRFGTKAYAVHKDLRVVQELMGHASPSTTAGYADYCNEDAISTVLGVQLDLRESQPDRRKLPVDAPGQQVDRTPDRIIRPRVDEGEPPVPLRRRELTMGGFKLTEQHGPAHDYPVRKPGHRATTVSAVKPQKSVYTLQIPHTAVQLNLHHGLNVTARETPTSSGRRSRRRRVS
jgi:integrase/recombinase XerC